MCYLFKACLKKINMNKKQFRINMCLQVQKSTANKKNIVCTHFISFPVEVLRISICTLKYKRVRH